MTAVILCLCGMIKKTLSEQKYLIGIYGNSKGAGIALLAASVVPDISLVIAASAFGHIMQVTGKPSDEPCKAMVSFNGRDFPYVEKGSLFSDFLKRCVKERNVRLLYFFDEWDRKGTRKTKYRSKT